MKINRLSVLFFSVLLIVSFVSCRNDEMQEAITENTGGIIFRLQKATYMGSKMIVEWNREDDTMAVPDFSTPIRVDVNASALPEDVSVIDNGQTVVLPYTDVDAVLALECADELQYMADNVRGLSVEPLMAEDGVTATNTYRIKKEWWRIGVPGEAVSLRFKRKGLDLVYPDDCIKIVLTENPIEMEGLMDFTLGYEYDFAKYIDNELGRLRIPEGKCLVVEYEADEDPWIKLEPLTEDDSQIRVLAGWKLNDRTANGRSQSARLVISNEDGSQKEECTVVRRNWGLPVTKQGGHLVV